MLSTIPWDSYLIRNRIWTYPPNVIIGPTLLKIPAEEVFFFVIQTYNTSLLYLVLSKPTLHPVYLRGKQAQAKSTLPRWRLLGQIALLAGIIGGSSLVYHGGEGLYMGLILIWALPFLLFLWFV